MATHTYQKPDVRLEQLQEECLAAGLPVETIRGPDAEGVITVHTTRDLTAEEVTTLDGVVSAHAPQTDLDRKRARVQALLDSLDTDLGVIVQALALVMREGLNQVRQQPVTTFPAITVVQMKQSVKDKVQQLLT